MLPSYFQFEAFNFRLEKSIRSLMAAYDKRSWVQTTWILVRIWKVSVFKNKNSNLKTKTKTKVNKQK